MRFCRLTLGYPAEICGVADEHVLHRFSRRLPRGCEKIGTGTSRHPLFACFSATRFGASPLFSQPLRVSLSGLTPDSRMLTVARVRFLSIILTGMARTAFIVAIPIVARWMLLRKMKSATVSPTPERRGIVFPRRSMGTSRRPKFQDLKS